MHISTMPRFAGGAPMSKGYHPLTDDEVRALAPSVFADRPHESRSERFAYIPTVKVLEGMRAEGFVPMKAAQGRSRIPGKAEFTKHLIRFRHAGDIGIPELGRAFPEVVLVNAHDGTSSYRVMAGLFRLVCLNGMVVQDENHGSLKVSHKGNVVNKVIEGSYEVLQESRKAIEAAANWSQIRLTEQDQLVMAQAAHVVRFGDAEGNVHTPIRPEQLLIRRRVEDENRTLWNTHNVLQENTVKGGLTARGTDANGRSRWTTTREVKNIDGDLRLNRALWMISEHMAKQKAV